MRLPAVALAASFAGGILLGYQPFASQHANARAYLAALLIGISLAISAALFLAARNHTPLAGMTALLCWAALGVLAAALAQKPLPAEHVLRRLTAGQLSLKSPLRWHGHLRTEPSRLP
jgi:peptidoglycan/LPS O-acetylase OafA/YrhL